MHTKKSPFQTPELTWLSFNARVLQEATDRRSPLYERLKFLAIFSSNLDEFFKVKVSKLRQIKNISKLLRKKKEFEEILKIQIDDSFKTREISKNKTNEYLKPLDHNKNLLRYQNQLITYLSNKLT